MNTEQLKMIIDMLQSAGHGAFWIAMFYILQDAFVAIVVSTTVIIVVTKVSTLVYQACSLRGQLERVIGTTLEPGYAAAGRLLVLAAEHAADIRGRDRL